MVLVTPQCRRVADPYADVSYGASRRANVPEQLLREPYEISRSDPYASRPTTAAVTRSDEGSISPGTRDLDDPYAGPASRRVRLIVQTIKSFFRGLWLGIYLLYSFPFS